MSKIEFTDLTQPDPNESKMMSSYFASLVLTYMSKLSIALRLTSEEVLRGALLVAESATTYSIQLDGISKERLEEIRQEVVAQSQENYEKMKEDGRLDEVKKMLEESAREKKNVSE